MTDQSSERRVDTGDLTLDQTLELFKFYEGSAATAKAQAWLQTTWILALNAGILAFSVDFYAKHGMDRGLSVIESLATGVGLLLCVFLIYLLHELGNHIRRYWNRSNVLIASSSRLTQFLANSNANGVDCPRCRPPFPKFCRRLQYLAAIFIVAHIGWLWVALFHLSE